MPITKSFVFGFVLVICLFITALRTLTNDLPPHYQGLCALLAMIILIGAHYAQESEEMQMNLEMEEYWKRHE